ncbi:DUF1385 domain-containing protein [Candidatus Caldatribacterium sp.]|uniref:DUF1385 domain-containing protein n=1 Tax=Candidatus Caldatribacterium sp. TaxID=2282143 RepID=UPI003845CA8A|nr:DUF1385 domain-containing protein [Candidatus Caldatribacterium sp.]
MRRALGDNVKKECDIGGQALIEGVMMRGPHRLAMAVRRFDGTIALEVREVVPLSRRHRLFSLPIIRGIVSLVDSLVVGLRALSYSAQVAFDEEAKLSSFDIGMAILLAFGLFVGLFIALPTFVTSLLDQFFSSTVVYNLVEGGIRIGIFLLYLLVISQMKDIRRVFEYHGAEHKAIFAFEEGDELTPESAMKFTTRHPRCGTSWLLVVMVVSILIFSLLGRPGILVRIVSRILVVPLVAGLAYEAIKLLSRNRKSVLARLVSLPGLWLQYFTTREPDYAQLEVAFAALRGSLGEDVAPCGERR